MAFFTALKDKVISLNKKMDDCQEAITFSMAGVDQDTDHMLSCKEDQGRNLVVATQESRFTEDMITYALEMAQRMDYNIIAVNAANLTHEVTEFFSSTQENLYKEFIQTANEKILDFKERAEALGIKFAHSTHFSNTDHAIDEISKQCGQVEFIITENREKAPLRNEVENTQRIAQRLCVYSVN